MTKEQAIERLKIKLDNDKKYLEQCNPFSDLVNEVRLDNKSIEIVLSMLKEKDKQIDLMANHIATSDSDLCEYLDITTKCQYYAGENKKLCDDCIKQYFENEAKELINK